MRNIGTTILVLLAIIGFSRTGNGQASTNADSFTIGQAVALALRGSPDHRLASLDVEAAKVDERRARSALLPILSFAEIANRGNDPVYVFGTRLRQQRFSQSDFALNALNRPTPIGNFATRFSGEWVAFDSWKTEFGIQSAGRIAAATRSAATRADQEIVHRVVNAYQGVLIAQKHLEVARHEVATAQALVARSESRVGAGVAVESDALSAKANLSARQQEEIAAEGDVEIAWAELERAAGATIATPMRTMPELKPAELRAGELSESIHQAFEARSDRKSLTEAAEASHSAVSAARSSFAPTLRAFGDWEQDRGSFASSGGNNWVAGVELNIDLLPIAKRQQLAGARIAEERAQARMQSAEDQIRLEVTRAWFSQQAASRMVEVAQASRAQGAESLRILRNRYEAGLATMTELLRAEDVERQSEANYWAAVSRSRIAWCDLEFAMGTLSADNLSDFE